MNTCVCGQCNTCVSPNKLIQVDVGGQYVCMLGAPRNDCVYGLPIKNNLQDLECSLHVLPRLPCKNRVGKTIDKFVPHSCKFLINLKVRHIQEKYGHNKESCQILSSFMDYF